ncbi:hypothetical protein HMPREF0352_2064, partial [Enterococcus faecium TX1330]|uniref:hypothetical protein n=1 Tax=Enterococcus faecium TaxID=1352 RepID=UPI00019CC13E
ERGREPAVQLRVTRNNFKKSFSCLMNIVTEELVGEHRLKKRLRNQCFDLIIRETNGKIVLHISPFFERMPRSS